MSKFHIRFNTKHNGNISQVWRIFQDGTEHLASDVKIFSPLYTETTVEFDEIKWNVACNGCIIWDGTVAIITNEQD